jgi:hypothetical protein
MPHVNNKSYRSALEAVRAARRAACEMEPTIQMFGGIRMPTRTAQKILLLSAAVEHSLPDVTLEEVVSGIIAVGVEVLLQRAPHE